MIAPLRDETRPAQADPGRSVVDLSLRVETPENIVLTYTLAGPMLRAAAYMIDFAIRAAVLGALAMVLLCSAMITPHFAIGTLMILLFLSSWFYYTLFEAYWNGRTPGKYVMGLRVVKEKGYPITFLAAFGRNLARVVDAIGFYTVGFVVMLLSPRFQRLGDWLAQTVVVCERSVRLPREPLILDRIESLPRESISGISPPPRTLALIDEYLGRRGSVSIARGHEIARPLARALARRLIYNGPAEYVEDYPMAFLARVHVTFLRRGAEEAEAPPLRREAAPARSKSAAPSLFE